MAVRAERELQPQHRHKARFRGIYVDLADTGRDWVLPVDVSEEEARNEITDAINDYSHERLRLTEEAMRTVSERYSPQLSVDAMCNARAEMKRHVDLWQPEWPKLRP